MDQLQDIFFVGWYKWTSCMIFFLWDGRNRPAAGYILMVSINRPAAGYIFVGW